MIILNTHRSEIYCKIIHSYLEVEIFGDSEIDIGDTIEIYMPKYLFREQYKKCIEVFKDLYEWTNDCFWHELTAFHEVALYYFLIKMSNIKEGMQENFKKIYYDKKLREEIEDSARKDKKDLKEFTIKQLKEDYYNPDYICNEIFEDIDFVELPYLYNEQKANMPTMTQLLGINLDYYFEILPIDIQKQYKRF